MGTRRPWLGMVLSAVAVGVTTFAVNAPPASAALPLIFNDALVQSGQGQTNYAPTDLARAASDITGPSPAILRFTVPWTLAQPYCLGVLGNKVRDRTSCQTPGPIQWNWTGDGINSWPFHLQDQLDSISTSYLQYGKVKLLPIVSHAPGWAWGVGETQDMQAQGSYDPNHPDMPPGGDSTALGWWQQFNNALVSWLESRYGRSSVAGVEVWNEEDNWPYTWSTTSSDYTTMSARYSQVLCSAYAGIWPVDGSLPVIFGGFYPLDGYLQYAYTSPLANIKNCMTAIGIHPYNDVGGWSAPNTPDSAFDAGPGSVAQTSQSNNDAGRPIWITEFGYPQTGVTAQQQADWDTQAYNLAPGKPNVQAMGIHTIFDQPGGFQICAGPLNPLPAATQLKQAVSGDPSAVATC